MKKINLLLIVCNNVLNGTERYVVDLAKNINKDEFNVYVAVPMKGPLSEILKENSINEVLYDNGKLYYYSFKGIRNLYRIMKKLKIDIVHANAKFQPCIAGKLAGVKLNVESRHGIFYSANQLEKLSIFRKLYEYSKQFFIDDFIAISDNDKKTLIKYFRIRSKKISVLYLGVDIEEIANNCNTVFNYRAVNPESNFIIGHVGRFTFQKAQEYLLEAFKRISEKYQRAKLVIVGSGENKEDIIRFINENNLHDKVIIKEYINKIYSEISSFDVHILTSRYEGTPYVNFEAMALGIPVISSDTGGISNILTNGFDSLITRVGNTDDAFKAIESLILDESLRKKLILNAFETVKKYTVQNMAVQTAQYYILKLKN